MAESLASTRRDGGRGSDRGRPRDPLMDGAILAVTIDLLSVVGYAGLTVAEVARRAEVSKPAIYRRWAQKSQLVVEAVVTQLRVEAAPDSGSTVDDLIELAGQLIVVLTRTPYARVLPGLVAEMAADPALAESYRELVIRRTRLAWRTVVERGIARGDLRADTDIEFVIDVLTGPLYTRVLVTGAPIEPGYPAAVADLVMARYGTKPTAG